MEVPDMYFSLPSTYLEEGNTWMEVENIGSEERNT